MHFPPNHSTAITPKKLNCKYLHYPIFRPYPHFSNYPEMSYIVKFWNEGQLRLTYCIELSVLFHINWHKTASLLCSWSLWIMDADTVQSRQPISSPWHWGLGWKTGQLGWPRWLGLESSLHGTGLLKEVSWGCHQLSSVPGWPDGRHKDSDPTLEITLYHSHQDLMEPQGGT